MNSGGSNRAAFKTCEIVDMNVKEELTQHLFSSIRHILGEQCGLHFVLIVPYTLVLGQRIGLE